MDKGVFAPRSTHEPHAKQKGDEGSSKCNPEPDDNKIEKKVDADKDDDKDDDNYDDNHDLCVWQRIVGMRRAVYL